MALYDGQELADYADRVYREAQVVSVKYAIGFAGLGLIAGAAAQFWILTELHPGLSPGMPGNGATVGAVLLGVVGYALGSERSLRMTLESQVALCLAKIEENTTRVEPPKTASETGPEDAGTTDLAKLAQQAVSMPFFGTKPGKQKPGEADED